MRTGIDVQVENHSSIWIITPVSKAAREWVYENVEIEDHMRWGAGFAADWRQAQDIVEGMAQEGFKVVM